MVTLTSELARSYIEYRSLQSQLHITHANLVTQQRTLELTELLEKEGVGTRYDIVRARAQTETTKAQIPALETQLTAALRQLEVLLGRQPGALDTALNQPSSVPTAPAQEILASPTRPKWSSVGLTFALPNVILPPLRL